MDSILHLNFQFMDHISLWGGFANAMRMGSSVSTSMEPIRKMIKEALKLKIERKTNSASSIIINRLKKRGIDFPNKIENLSLDSNEIVGLIGEMIVEDFVAKPHVKPIYIKWRKSGTSKSRGIDLIVIDQDSGQDILLLLEAKHSHRQIIKATNTQSVITKRFEEGLDEFEHEKTITSLGNILAQFSDEIAISRAMKVDYAYTEKLCDFLIAKIKANSYNIQICNCIDNVHSNKDIFTNSMNSVNSATSIGLDDGLVLNLIEIQDLDKVTDSILSNYA